MITIGGTSVKTPSDYSVGIFDIDKAERNANGNAILENITKKRKLELTWKYLSKAELNTIQGLVKGASRTFTVTYIDLDGESASGTFYSGDLVPSAMDYLNSVIRWKNVRLSLIEI
jgi:hypothetical protein